MIFRRPQTRDIAIQVDGKWDPQSRAGCRIFEDTRHIGHRCPVPQISPEVQDVPKDATLCINLKQKRRRNDCGRCIRHARLLAKTPVMLGLHYVTLPGLHQPSSTTTNRGRLADALRLQADKTLVVCSCSNCTVHRNFVTTWIQARQLIGSRREASPAIATPHRRRMSQTTAVVV